MSTFPKMQRGARGTDGMAASGSRLGSTSSSSPSARTQQSSTPSSSSMARNGQANKTHQQPRKLPALIRMPTEPSDPTVASAPSPVASANATLPAVPETATGPMLKLRLPVDAATSTVGSSSSVTTSRVTSAYAASTQSHKGSTSYAGVKPTSTPLSRAKISPMNPTLLLASKASIASSKPASAIPIAPKAFNAPTGFRPVQNSVKEAPKVAALASVPSSTPRTNLSPTIVVPNLATDNAAVATTSQLFGVNVAGETVSKNKTQALLDGRALGLLAKPSGSSPLLPTRVSTPVSLPPRPASALPALPASALATMALAAPTAASAAAVAPNVIPITTATPSATPSTPQLAPSDTLKVAAATSNQASGSVDTTQCGEASPNLHGNNGQASSHQPFSPVVMQISPIINGVPLFSSAAGVEAAVQAKQGTEASSTTHRGQTGALAKLAGESGTANRVEAAPATQEADKPSTSVPVEQHSNNPDGSDIEMDLESSDDERGEAESKAVGRTDADADTPMLDMGSSTMNVQGASAIIAAGDAASPTTADATGEAASHSAAPPPFRPYRPSNKVLYNKQSGQQHAYTQTIFGKRKSSFSKLAPNKVPRVERHAAPSGRRIVSLPVNAISVRRKTNVASSDSSDSEESLFEPTQLPSSAKEVMVGRRQTRARALELEKRALLHRPQTFATTFPIPNVVLPSREVKWCCAAQAWFHVQLGLACENSLASEGAMGHVGIMLQIRADSRSAPPSEAGDYDMDDSPRSSTILPFEHVPVSHSHATPKSVPSSDVLWSNMAKLRKSAQKDAAVPFKTSAYDSGVPLFMRKPMVEVLPARPLPSFALHFAPQSLANAINGFKQASRSFAPSRPSIPTSAPSQTPSSKATPPLPFSSGSAPSDSSLPLVPSKRPLEEDAVTEQARVSTNGAVDPRAHYGQPNQALPSSELVAPVHSPLVPEAGTANGLLHAEVSAELARLGEVPADVSVLAERLEGVLRQRLQRELATAEEKRAQKDALLEKRLAALERALTAAEKQRARQAKEQEERCRQLEQDLAKSEAALRRFGSRAQEQNRLWGGLKQLATERSALWQQQQQQQPKEPVESSSRTSAREDEAAVRRRKEQEAKDAALAAMLAEQPDQSQSTRPRRAAALRAADTGPSPATAVRSSGAPPAPAVPATRSARLSKKAATPSSVHSLTATEHLEQLPSSMLQAAGIRPNEVRSLDDINALLAQLKAQRPRS